MILIVLWDGHFARHLYLVALMLPTLQDSYLNSATPKFNSPISACQIVEETDGGKLSFNSVLGQGTEFFIEIAV